LFQVFADAIRQLARIMCSNNFTTDSHVCIQQACIIAFIMINGVQVHDRKSQTAKYRTDNMKKINPRTKDQIHFKI
jgi:hypothetical protein